MNLDKAIATSFDAEALADLAAEAGVEFTVPPGGASAERAKALIAATAAQGRAAGLLAALAARRPDIAWATIPFPRETLETLHVELDRRLDLDGLRTLCFRLGVDYDSLPGEGKSARARELVLAMERAGRTAELLDSAAPRRRAGREARRNRLAPPPKPVTSLVALLLCLLIATAWWYSRPDELGAALPEAAVGVAVAEFAESTDCRRGERGREAGALIYDTLEREVAAAGLRPRVALTRVGLVCDAAAAVAAGERVAADLVVWGWLPATADGLYGELTVVGAPPASADMAGSFAALLSGPGLEPSYRLSGRAALLARFLVGLVLAGEGEQARAEARFSEVIALAAQPDAGAPDDTLAVAYTERGKTYAARGDLERAAADYARAEALNPHSIRLLVNLAGYHYLRRDWDAAERYLDRAALADDPLPSVAYGYGLLDYYRGDYRAAIAHFDTAVALSEAAGQRPVTAWLARGYSYVNLGDCRAAGQSFLAVSRSEGAPAALRAAAETELGRCDRAAGSPGATRVAPRPAELPVSIVALDAGERRPRDGQPAGAGATPALPQGPLMAAVGTRGANVRQGPGAEYAVMVTRRAGAQLEVLAMNVSGEWLQVRVPGRGRGWVSAEYVAVLGDPALIAAATANYERYASRSPLGDATLMPGATPIPGAPFPRAKPPSTPPPGASPTPPAPPYGTHTPPAPRPTQTPARPVLPTPTLLPLPTAMGR